MTTNIDHTPSQFYLSVLEGISEPLIVIKKDYTVSYANKTVRHNREHRLRDQKCYSLLHGRETPCEECPCERTFKTGQSFRVIRSDGNNGGAVQKEIRGYPIFNEEGRVNRVIEMIQDIPVKAVTSQNDVEHKPAQEDHPSFCGMIGRSKKMKALFHLIRLIAPSNATVLIYGESGTGKERVAQAVHQMSKRRLKPFIAIDCGALPETLLESELFGHVKGAFTGAFQNKKGLFQEAEGGTLFLDEIVDTSLVFQSKLLRALQEGEARPVGGTRNVKFNVRLLAATNRSLKDAIRKNTFREDLYYRLAVMPMMIPPLRGRIDDVPLLSEYFIRKYTLENEKGPMHLSKEVAELLLRMPWKGNVRELENIIERGVLVSQGPEITLDSLLIDEEDYSLGYTSSSSLLGSTKEAIIRMEKEKIIESLNNNNWNKSKAAKTLRISRASLYNKLKQYQISSSI